MQRIAILDGWRALSILMVLAGHLLPIGPRSWAMNVAVAGTGMALFFTLSGFLITQFMLHRPDVRAFLIRRLFRIVPLAWAAMAVLAIATRADLATVLANFLFVSNLPPTRLMHGGEHLWSLCVEVQFYATVALIVAVAGARGLRVLPVLCVAVTIGRAVQGAMMSNYTWQRVDEILAGATLALLHAHFLRRPRRVALPAWLPLVLLALTVAAAHGATGALNYLRPYLAAAAVGTSIVAAPGWMRAAFASRPARYVADISYALYVFHGMLSATWLGSGDTLVRYAKRPLLFAATFATAHLSTFRFEHPMIALGKRLERRGAVSARPAASR